MCDSLRHNSQTTAHRTGFVSKAPYEQESDPTTAQPYHNLDPARAAARLGPTVDTTRFAEAAAFLWQGP